MNKKLTALFTAAAMILPMFNIAHVSAAGTLTSPEVTVVGKRITGDDTYFEISLEVNNDYEEYSAVGVVLRYDPDYIVPAESWDDDAGELDLYAENARTWGTRRALPTLGKETWSTQTALAYEDYVTDLSAGTSKKWGYLYLGAEYPGVTPDDSSASASASPAATTAPTVSPTTAPTADPSVTPDPDIYQNPVVAVRFMYKNTAAAGADDATIAASRLAQKTALETQWLNLDALGNVQTPNWDGANWPNNEILTIVTDDIAKTSPAQYPFAYYRANLEEYAYMWTWPVVATPDPSALPMPVADALNLVKEVGSDVDTAHQLAQTDIEICLGEGKSAKATGGLTLSEVFAILFFDWDDSFLGALTGAVGQPLSSAVHKYVEETFIHPDLRTDKINYESLTAAEREERKYNYRGEYPENGPSTSDPLAKSGAYGDTSAEPGSKYPLTNKLDYAFAGKDLVDSNNPYVFAYGWTQVLSSTPDYSDTTKYPGLLPQVLPKNMTDTFTAEDPTMGQTFARCPELDSAGQLVNPTDTIPTWISYDFDNIKNEDVELSGGNLYVKAVYTGCEWLSLNASGGIDNHYAIFGPANTQTVGTVTATSATYEISFAYERINVYGHGVHRMEDPMINMAMTQNGATASTPIKLGLDNLDKIPVALTPTNAVSTVGYQIRDKDVISGAARSDANGLGVFTLSGKNGIVFQYNLENLLNAAYPYAYNVYTTGVKHNTVTATYNETWTDAATWSGLHINRTASATKLTAVTGTTYIRLAQCAIVDYMALALQNGDNPYDLTWYQLQYAVVNKGTSKTKVLTYVDSNTAESYIRTNYPLMAADYDAI